MAPEIEIPLFQRAARPVRSSAFTLVEMLVVITIIGILAALITAAAISARRTAKNAAVGMEVKQLEMALQAYKEKLGEYPPDFAGVNGSLDTDTTNYPIRTAARNAVLRHLARAFPRYVPGVSTTADATDNNTWAGFQADVANATTGWNLNVNNLTPVGAIAFWLGGQPEWNGAVGANPTKPVTAFRGFSANVANPFDNSPSRIQPFYEFNLMCLLYMATDGIATWPASACDQGTSPLVYFRANNGTYIQEGSTTTIKFYGRVYPAIDTRLSNLGTPTLTWVNPKTFQIFSSGLDMTYGSLSATAITNYSNNPNTNNVLQFPAGTNYAPETFDDITNFSGGILEDAIPQ